MEPTTFFLCTDIAHLAAVVPDPSDLADEVRRHEALVSAAVTAHGGQVWLRGDGPGGVLPSVGAAVEAAVAVMTSGDEGPLPGVALDAGTATAVGTTWVGPTATRAGRLAALAGPANVVVSDDLAQHLEAEPIAGVRLRPLGPWELPGVATSDVHALEVGAVGARRGGPALLAGGARQRVAMHRDAEHAALVDAVGRASTTAGVVVVEGEAGVGKTVLWHDTIADARRRGMRVFMAAAAGGEQDVTPFGLLRDLLADVGDAELEALPTLQRDVLETVLLRSVSSGPAPWQLVAAAVHALLSSLAARRPVLVAVDDLAWSDDDTARVLETSVRRCLGQGVVVLVTHRIGPGGTDVDWATRLAPLPVRRRVVGAMDPEDLAEVLRAQLDDPRSLRALERLAHDAAGNPLLALELARSRSPVRESSGSTIERVRRRVEERLEAVGEGSLLLLQVLAVAPRSQLDEIVAVVPEIGVGRAVDTLERAGLLVVEATRLRFAHPIQRHAVLATVEAVDRREIHRRLAAVVADPVEAAAHRGHATVTPDEDVAAGLERAASLAAGRGAVGAAAGLADRAVELTVSTAPADRVRRMLLAAVLHWQDGDRGRCVALLDEAALTATTDDDLARVLVARSRLWDMSFPPDADLRAALSWSDLQPDTRIALHLALTLLDLLVMENGSAARTGRAGLAIEGATDGSALERQFLGGATGFAEVFLGEPAGWALMAEAVERRRADGVLTVDLQNDPRTFLAMARFHHDDLDGARALIEPLIGEAEALGLGGALAVFSLMRAQIAVRAGHVDVAEELLQRLRPPDGATRDAADLMQLADAFGQGLLAVARGDEEQARGAAAVAGSYPVGMMAWRLVATAAPGQVALALGDAAEADRILAPLPAVEDEQTDALLVPQVHRVRGDAAEAAVLVGDLDRAATLAADLEALAEISRGSWPAAAAARVRALLAFSHGSDDAVTLAERAVATARDLPDPMERARSSLVAGMVHRRSGSRTRARGLLEEAQRLFADLGNRPWRDRATAELARISGRRPSDDDGGLTPTQQSIADLVAQGLTNREVASQLHLSPKTVENNLTAVYRALGIRSRTELAARR